MLGEQGRQRRATRFACLPALGRLPSDSLAPSRSALGIHQADRSQEGLLLGARSSRFLLSSRVVPHARRLRFLDHTLSLATIDAHQLDDILSAIPRKAASAPAGRLNPSNASQSSQNWSSLVRSLIEPCSTTSIPQPLASYRISASARSPQKSRSCAFGTASNCKAEIPI